MADNNKKAWFLPIIVAFVGFFGVCIGGYITYMTTLKKLERETRERNNQALLIRYVDNVINPLHNLYEDMADIHIGYRSPEEDARYYLYHGTNMPVEWVNLDSNKVYKSFIDFRKKANELIFLDESIQRAFIRQAGKMAYETPLIPGYYFLGGVNVHEINNLINKRREEGIDKNRLEKYLTIVDWGARFMQRNLTIIKEHIISTSFENYHDFFNRFRSERIGDEKVQRALDLLRKYCEQEEYYMNGDENPLFIFLKIYIKYQREGYFSKEYLEVLNCALGAYKKNRNIVDKFYDMVYAEWNRDKFLKEMSCVEKN